VATDLEGELTYVAQVGSGLTGALETRLLKLMKPLMRATPLVACKVKGRWVEPKLFCTVSFNEWTADLRMRGPVLEKLHDA
jgi:ATP-dependent DNA ligase